MSQTPPSGQVATVKPKANVYTVLVIIAILALGSGIAFCLQNLMSPEPAGYGMKFDQLFKKWEPPPGVDSADGGGAAKKADSK
ncbi:MAG: hypothetical protein HZA50_09710 [Planctomycetes bacterium]|nr:hypothetical protein [Planctomycetota bacterium]